MKRLSELPRRDLELLSAYLDDGLSPRQERKLLGRLEREPDLRWALDELRRTVEIVRSLPEVRPRRSYALSPEKLGIRPRAPAYPFLPLATALATLAFVAVVGLDTLASFGRASMQAPAPGLGERVAAPQVEAPEETAPSTEMPALGMTQPEQAPQALSVVQAASPTPQATTEGLGGGPAATPPGAIQSFPTQAAEDRALEPSGTPCSSCGGGEAGPLTGEPPFIAMAPQSATEAPAAAPTESTVEKFGETAAPNDLGNAPSEFTQPLARYRPGLSPIRLAEITLGLAAVIMAALTLWVRRRT